MIMTLAWNEIIQVFGSDGIDRGEKENYEKSI